jgi:serine/threonine-protein kinase HipA
MKDNVVLVKIWGREVGYVVWDTKRRVAVFEYAPDFVKGGLDIAPLTMSVNSERSKRGLPWTGDRDKLYQGLPPMLADSLPDKWGDSVFRNWLGEQKIPAQSISSVDRLSYIGSRGMGALEYEPAHDLGKESFEVNVAKLYDFAREITRERMNEAFTPEESLLWRDLVKVGTSAGGRRPKAIVAINDATGEVRSGQTEIPEGFKHYILKFGDGGYPASEIEYVYWLMARDAGIEMMPSRLMKFGGINHFLTERFDRRGNEKLHTQTMAAMNPASSDYDDMFALLRKMGMPYPQHEQLFRMMVFNVLSSNVDDHNKNFSMIMSPDGIWRLAPAYDMTFSYDLSAPAYVNRQSMTVNAKNDDIEIADMLKVAGRNEIGGAKAIIETVRASLDNFATLAKENGIGKEIYEPISRRIG